MVQYFQTQEDRAFSTSDLERLFIEKHQDWNLPPSMTSYTFLQMLLTRTHLNEIRLRSHSYPSLTRYSWNGKASPIAVALSIRKTDAFFSHSSAMWIHGLSDDDKNLFLNKEQSPKPQNASLLSQESIDRAFQNKQRNSRLSYKYKDARITLINGKYSGRLAVEQTTAPSGHSLDVTTLERTLVDITVRPAYAGGVPAVLQAFRLARNRISVLRLFDIYIRPFPSRPPPAKLVASSPMAFGLNALGLSFPTYSLLPKAGSPLR